ncbi:dCTP deaminase [Coriobacteriia bacterium Es71-Z0120]|uniref:dCTP deaminase n=1 Tax=Parvivirga hydrogeniphila TaxID=2939460 RepID=UPI002260E557|nr:dCTP deaminase [Parvivirga hydrogeniphila]MCL4079234.1 dCTP deaminase [Parvivirga hydrogeniphila]
MVLSDRSIKEQMMAGRIRIEPCDPDDIQPSSVDLHLGPRFQVFRNSRYPYIDPARKQDGLMELVEATAESPFVLHPGEFVLGTTVERIVLPDDIVARLEGKSSLGRLGLLIHSTAGYVDPGWDGRLTLELSNVANLPILLMPGMAIGQISFLQMTTPVDRPYGTPGLGSKYQGQSDVTPSRSYENF